MTSNLDTEILNWISTLPYWQQYLASYAYTNTEIDNNVIDLGYKYFKEDSGLLPEIDEKKRSPIIFSTSKVQINSFNYRIESIDGIQNVNAIKPLQILPIGAGITLIYGDNGSGKSSYIRLLNNAFYSKGDKKILHNIFSESSNGIPTANFNFVKQDGTKYKLEYPNDREKIEFKSYVVFDSESERKYLSTENGIEWSPRAFQFFDRFISIIKIVSERFNEEIESNSVENIFIGNFVPETSVGKLINSLSAKSDFNALEKLSEVTVEEDNNFKKNQKLLSELNLDTVKKKLSDIKNLKIFLNSLENNVKNIFGLFSKEKIESYKSKIEQVLQNTALANKLGIDRFNSPKFKNIDSKEWRTFIESSIAFANKQGDNYPKIGDNCIFCRQPLTNDSIALIRDYSSFIESSASENLKISLVELDKIKSSLSTLKFDILSDATLIGKWIVDSFPDIYSAISKNIANAYSTCSKIITSINEKKWDKSITEVAFDHMLIDLLRASLVKSENQYNLDEIEENKKKLERSIFEIRDRKNLKPLLNSIKSFIDKKKWIAQAETKRFSTSSITNKQKIFFEKYVTEDYVKEFNKECTQLNANFSVEIKSRGRNGTTVKRLEIKQHFPIEILSEGEQKVIAIADFLAEMKLNSDIKGVFFDDPVNSLDHKRRLRIANRIINLAKSKQVIIFTHDIAFYLDLKDKAERNNLYLTEVVVRKIDRMAGVVTDDLPWVAKNLKSRIKTLKEKLANFSSETDLDEYRYLQNVKEFCELLRESWERCVEELLFNNAVQRYNPAIQTNRLKKAPFTIELYNELENNMSECSKWVHDQASALNTSPPDKNELEAFLKKLEDYCKPLYKYINT